MSSKNIKKAKDYYYIPVGYKKKHHASRMKIRSTNSLTIGHRRVLTRSEREILHKIRDPRNFIWPWIEDPDYRFHGNAEYPHASLVGLPAELRRKTVLEVLGPEEVVELEGEKKG
ncbi:hypothetical protein GQ43DRAFT_439778 [Delitschia confertaspora ATCC 74209]|uniref:Uncharacterized protein n=1 Tax=Delitschia confertaspora ATCC 74209 TaxID=1513339 RepID=A0A9P4MTA7_9PLEO|nr:hypothetical protein GQ43DRAFT_439778 [Delitschia confertaspora ATCC 74209]